MPSCLSLAWSVYDNDHIFFAISRESSRSGVSKTNDKCDALPTELWSLVGSRSRASSMSTSLLSWRAIWTEMIWINHIYALRIKNTSPRKYIVIFLQSVHRKAERTWPYSQEFELCLEFRFETTLSQFNCRVTPSLLRYSWRLTWPSWISIIFMPSKVLIRRSLCAKFYVDGPSRFRDTIDQSFVSRYGFRGKKGVTKTRNNETAKQRNNETAKQWNNETTNYIN